MAHSLEVRVPFLDHHLVETAARMPDSVKIRRGDTKHVLRVAAKGLVPDWVLSKRKLGFFAASTSHWLSADNGAIVDDVLLSPDRRYAELVSPAVMAGVARDWRAGVDHTQFLLAMVMLELWLDSYLPRAFAVTRSAPAGREYEFSSPLV
jgi:asparagine synthase (glutamine-hydrolysing)